MTGKPRVFFTSNVFLEIGENDKISEEVKTQIKSLWSELRSLAEIKIFDGRFPKDEEIEEEIKKFDPQLIGCHLSHPIKSSALEGSNVVAVLTSTAGYNHIQRTSEDNIIITHTPGVLHQTVADYTIALIMANLRNIIDLHFYVWNEEWKSGDKWDLDQDLSSVIDNKTLGIVGLGEIGTELVKRVYPWGLKIIYYDKNRCRHTEEEFPGLECKASLEELFKESDIVSLHIPLNKHTKHLINKDLLKLMKQNALLVNTARGGVINFGDLLSLIENGEIKIHLAFDVYPEEPIEKEMLERFKKIKKSQPSIRMVLMPHNASADADTRGKMDILFLSDLISIIKSSNLRDLKDVHIIPEHQNILNEKDWKILEYWNKKNQ
ncbi:MAG: hypothetical protein GF353_17465 [Candidatus Lokiarchaeota archaeon]|nr:hypothetical protein [Candidatus Lokiarchaeota archaeon]